MSNPSPKIVAVCPPLESTEPPRLYRSLASANRFLRSEAIFPLPGDLGAESRTQRAERREQRRRQREQAQHQIKLGKRPPFSFPTTYRNLGWNSVRISCLAEHAGQSVKRSIREFIGSELREPMIELTLEEQYERALQDRTGNYSCFLGPDWSYLEIETAATKVWLDRPSPAASDAAPVLLQFVTSLENILHKTHPHAPASAIADFWSSWQVHRHLMRFCRRYQDSKLALQLASDNAFISRELVERDRCLLLRWFTEFSYELRSIREYRKSSVPDRYEDALVGMFRLREKERVGFEPKDSHIYDSIPVDQSTFYEWKRGGRNSKKVTDQVRQRIEDFLENGQVNEEIVRRFSKRVAQSATISS